MRFLKPLQICFLILCSSIATSSFARDLDSCDLDVRTFAFPPFAIKDQHEHWSGIDMEYTRILLEHAGCNYRFVEMPWGRGLEMMRSGQVDMMINVTKTRERSEYLYFVGPQRMEILRFVSKKDALPVMYNWEQMGIIKGSLIRQRGTLVGQRFEQLLADFPVIRKRLLFLPNTTNRIDLIRKGRAIGFFAEQSFLQHEFANNPDYDILQLHPLIVNRSPVHYAFSKASVSKKLIEALQRSYEELYKLKKIQAVEGHYDLY